MERTTIAKRMNRFLMLFLVSLGLTVAVVHGTMPAGDQTSSFGDIFKYIATWFLVFALLTILSAIQRRMDSLQQQAKRSSKTITASKAIAATRIPTGKTVFLAKPQG
jgi:hypothetical protein